MNTITVSTSDDPNRLSAPTMTLMDPEILYRDLSPGKWRGEEVTIETRDLPKHHQELLGNVLAAIQGIVWVHGMAKVGLHTKELVSTEAITVIAPNAVVDRLGTAESESMAAKLLDRVRDSLYRVLQTGVEQDLFDPEIGRSFEDELRRTDNDLWDADTGMEIVPTWYQEPRFDDLALDLGSDDDEPDEMDFGDESTPRGKNPFADRGQAIFAWCRDFIEYINALAREERASKEYHDADWDGESELLNEDR